VVKRLNGSLDLTSDHTRALSATIRFIALGLGIAAINLPNFKSLSSTQYENTKGEGPRQKTILSVGDISTED